MPTRTRLLATALTAVAATVLGLAGAGGSPAVAATTGGAAHSGRAAHAARATTVLPRLFSAGSFWNRQLDPRAPLAPTSAAVAARVANQAGYSSQSSPVQGWYPPGWGTMVNEDRFSVPIYTVPANQPLVPVTWVVDDKGTPAGPDWAAGLQASFARVPVPTGIRQLAANGTDAHVAIWQPSTDTYWEFWVFAASADSAGTHYTARYGARIPHVSQASGVLPNQWGARATSLALAGGVIRMDEYAAGVIPHALAIALPVVDGGVLAPATRTDGPGGVVQKGDGRDAVSEGTRLRLPASTDCAGMFPVPTQKLVRLLCVAARDYGIVVVDRTGGVTSFYAEDDRTVGTPYQSVRVSPWRSTALDGMPSGLLSFPWKQLQQLAPTAPARAPGH